MFVRPKMGYVQAKIGLIWQFDREIICSPDTSHYVPYSLQRVCGFFNVPQIFFYYMCKGLWDRAYGLSSLSEKTRKSNRLQMLLQRQHFLLSYLKTLSVGPAGVWTYGLPLSRLALDPLSLPGGGYEMCRDGMNLFQNESHSGIMCIAPYCCVVALMMQHVDARYSCKRSERWLWHFRPLRLDEKSVLA